MKTPLEVAREVLGADALAGVGYEKYLPHMVRAIEVDRAKIAADHVTSRAHDALMAAGHRALADELVLARAQHAADLATLAAAAANYAEHILDNIESMRADDEDRITDQAEHDEIIAAINRLSGTKEA